MDDQVGVAMMPMVLYLVQATPWMLAHGAQVTPWVTLGLPAPEVSALSWVSSSVLRHVVLAALL